MENVQILKNVKNEKCEKCQKWSNFQKIGNVMSNVI